MTTSKTARFVSGIGSHEPFNHWHSIKRTDEHVYTTSCGLYMMCVETADTINDVPLSGILCTSADCRMRSRLSQALNKCAVENRQSEWTVRY